ncbi:tRNA (cytosine-5-)-methyltransferase, partial [Nowakowskiella sp. JEL0078]
GKQLDIKDPRSNALLHLINMLSTIKLPPTYLFLENVPNFEKSESHNLLLNVLKKRGYVVSEYLLSPLLFGIPNDRLRYYLIARRTPYSFVSTKEPTIYTDIPTGVFTEPVRAIAEFVDLDVKLEEWIIPRKFVKSRSKFGGYVVVSPVDVRTTCFTKAYGHHGVGSGSFLISNPQHNTKKAERELEDPQKALDELGIRFFTPIE